MNTPVQSQSATRNETTGWNTPRAMRPARSRAGFTLLEVLVATGVLALMVTILFALFSEGSNAWRMGEKTAEVNQGVRTAMDLLIREVSLAVIDRTTNSQLRGLSVVIEKSSSAESKANDPTPCGVYEELRFVAPVQMGNETTNTAYGSSGYRSLCGVRYHVAKAPEAGGVRPVLGNLVRTIYYTTRKGSPSSFYDNPWSLGTGIETNSMLLAENVLTFRVQPAERDAVQGLVPAERQMFKDMGSDRSWPPITSSSGANYTNYPGVYIGLCIVDSRLASRINQLGLQTVAASPMFQTATNWTLVRFESLK